MICNLFPPSIFNIIDKLKINYDNGVNDNKSLIEICRLASSINTKKDPNEKKFIEYLRK